MLQSAKSITWLQEIGYQGIVPARVACKGIAQIDVTQYVLVSYDNTQLSLGDGISGSDLIKSFNLVG